MIGLVTLLYNAWDNNKFTFYSNPISIPIMSLFGPFILIISILIIGWIKWEKYKIVKERSAQQAYLDDVANWDDK